MDYVKFAKAKELKDTIDRLKENRKRLESLYDSYTEAGCLRENLSEKDYEKVLYFAIVLVDKHIDEAENEFRLL